MANNTTYQIIFCNAEPLRDGSIPEDREDWKPTEHLDTGRTIDLPSNAIPNDSKLQRLIASVGFGYDSYIDWDRSEYGESIAINRCGDNRPLGSLVNPDV